MSKDSLILQPLIQDNVRRDIYKARDFGINYDCKYLRVWTDVFYMRYPDTCESFSPAMSVINKSVFERDTDTQAPNEGKTADCHLPRIAKAMQKYHLQTQTHKRYKRANGCQKLSQFRVLVRGR